MNKRFIFKFISIIIISIIQTGAMNLKAEPKEFVEKYEAEVNYDDVKKSLGLLSNLIIIKEEFKGSKIIVETSLLGNEKEIEDLMKEINTNRFIENIENITLERLEESWKWSGVIVFNSYTEYGSFHKNE